jgi:hypothetical protein
MSDDGCSLIAGVPLLLLQQIDGLTIKRRGIPPPSSVRADLGHVRDVRPHGAAKIAEAKFLALFILWTKAKQTFSIPNSSNSATRLSRKLHPLDEQRFHGP